MKDCCKELERLLAAIDERDGRIAALERNALFQENEKLRANVERLRDIKNAAIDLVDNPHSLDFYLHELKGVLGK